MSFAPFGLTWSDLVGVVGLFGAVLVALKKLVIPWLRNALEEAIASDRGIRSAIQESLKPELDAAVSLRASVDELTRTMATSNQAFANLQSFVNEFCEVMRGEMHEVQRRMDDIERGQRYARRESDQ